VVLGFSTPCSKGSATYPRIYTLCAEGGDKCSFISNIMKPSLPLYEHDMHICMLACMYVCMYMCVVCVVCVDVCGVCGCVCVCVCVCVSFTDYLKLPFNKNCSVSLSSHLSSCSLWPFFPLYSYLASFHVYIVFFVGYIRMLKMFPNFPWSARNNKFKEDYFFQQVSDDSDTGHR
jgi:hypothetical protein